MQSNTILAIGPAAGDNLLVAGGEYRIVASGQQTDGRYAVIEMTVPPGAGPNPHSHESFEESFFVLEGEVTFMSEAGTYVAKEHSFIAIPKGGIVHHFKNLTERPAKLLCTVSPAGLDDFFLEVSKYMQAAKEGSYPDADVKVSLNDIAARSGQKLFSPDYLELLKK